MTDSFLSDSFDEAYERIQCTLQVAAADSRFYRDLFAQHAIEVRGIVDLRSFSSIPLTLNCHLVENPLDFLVMPLRSIRALGISSGAKPKIVFANEVVGERARRPTAEEKLGLVSGDHIAVMLYANNMGPTVTPRKWETRGISYVIVSQLVAKHNPRVLLEFLEQTEVRAIRSTPNFMLTLTRAAEQIGFEPSELELKFITVTGATLPENTRQYIETVWQTRMIGLWGCNEIGMMGIECKDGVSYHVDEEACFVEALSLDYQKQCALGEIGEAVVTKLRYDPIALIRYLLGNLIRFVDCPCDCGFGGRKLQVLGRSAEVVKVGKEKVPVYPYEVREVLSDYPQLSGRYRLIVDEIADVERLVFEIEPIRSLDDPGRLDQELAERIGVHTGVQREAGAGHVSISVSFQDPGTLSEEWGVKLQQSFVDLREQ